MSQGIENQGMKKEMKSEESLISELLDGSLDRDQSDALMDLVSQDPAVQSEIIQELKISEHLSRELDPKRSDEAFIESFQDLLDKTTQNRKITPLVLKIAAGFMICAGLLWQFALRPGEDSARMASIEEAGEGFKVHRGQTVIAAEKGMALRSGDLIVSSQPDQRLAFTFTDGSEASVSDGGSIRLEESHNKGKLLSLESGKAHFRVNKQQNTFQVTTQHGTATVVGTSFDVTTNASSMNLNVTEGAVNFNNKMNHQIMVGAGEQAIARKDNPRIRRAITLVATHSETLVTNSRNSLGPDSDLLTKPRITGKVGTSFILTYDLSSIPENIVHVSLRLYCIKSEAQPGIITMHADQAPLGKVHNGTNWWRRPAGTDRPILASWSPEPDKYNMVELSDDILTKLNNQTDLRFRLSCTSSAPTKDQRVEFASSQHPDKEKWPVLILEIED